MNRLILGAVGLAIASMATGCVYVEEEVGSGYARTVTKELPPYDEISVNDAFGNVDIRTCEDCESIRVTADDNLIDNIHAEVDDDGTLELCLNGVISPVTPIEVVIRTATLRKVEVRGASNVFVQGDFSDDFELDVSGASTVDFSGRAPSLEAELSGASTLNAREVEVASIDLDASGSSNITLSGTGGGLEVELSGASSLEASGLVTEDVTLDFSGSSSAAVCATGTIDAELSGASSLQYTCDPSVVRVDASGSSSSESF